MTQAKHQDWIEGLARGLSVLECFGQAQERMTLQQVAISTALTRYAARRQLFTLTQLGYVATDGKLYWLTAKVLRLAQNYIDSSRLVRITLPYLQRIAVGLQETAYLSVLEGEDLIFLSRRGTTQKNQSGYGIGERIAAPLTAGGLMLMSYWSAQAQVDFVRRYPPKNFTSYTISKPEELLRAIQAPRALGYAVSERQLDPMYRGIAVPVLDHKGIAHAALSVTLLIGNESTEQALARVLPLLSEMAQSLRNLI